MLKIGPPLFMTASPKKFCFEIAVLPSALFHVAFSLISRSQSHVVGPCNFRFLITVFQKYESNRFRSVDLGVHWVLLANPSLPSFSFITTLRLVCNS